MSEPYSLVITTTGSRESARALASLLLTKKLAACVQILPVESHYIWNGVIQHEAECALHIKTRTENFPALSEAIKTAHDYEVPEIIRMDIAGGDKPYLDWISQAATP
ncbi:MAG: divalent-cation tolerance protein CutA [Hyphomicrobiales bacterium]|nr:divalent-cation tolerance protein CutA [Hyphomicrobiales bacterium]